MDHDLETRAISRRRVIASTAGAAACILTGTALGQQAFPSKPIRLVVAFPAGGATDGAARALAEELTRLLGQTVFVENKAGATGSLGAEYVANASPDGYTLLFASTAQVAILQFLNPKLRYNPATDLAPVSLVLTAANVLVARKDLPANNLKEVVALAKARPKAISIGSPGVGGPGHLAVEQLQHAAGIELNYIPYKGEQAAFTDVAGGQLDLVTGSMSSALQMLKTAKVKIITVMSEGPSELLPNVAPASADFPGLVAVAFQGVHAPKGTPGPIVSKLAEGIAAAVQTPKLQAYLRAQGTTPVGGTPQQYETFLARERAKFEAVIQRAGIKMES